MKKNIYQRTTRECTFDELRPKLVAAIRQHIQERELGDVESEVLICCETTSERRKLSLMEKWKARLGGYYDPDPVHYTGIVVTSGWLVWATTGVKRGTVVLAARLTDIEVKDYDAKLVEDNGINVFGLVGRFPKRVSAFIGLGREEAAERLKGVLREAIQRANESRGAA